MVNFFYLDHSAKRTAKFYCDKHLFKIALEINQMLCNLHHKYLTSNIIPYKNCRAVIPSLGPYRWIQESNQNYKYALELSVYLLDEFKQRYNRKNTETKLDSTIKWNIQNMHLVMNKLPSTKRKTKFISSNMGLGFHLVSRRVVLNNRYQYVFLKCSNDKWSKSKKPEWFDDLFKKDEKYRKRFSKILSKWVNQRLPKKSKDDGYPVIYNHCFLRIIYDTLMEGKWNREVKNYVIGYRENKSLMSQLSFPQLHQCITIAKEIYKNKSLCIQLNKNSLVYRKKLPRSALQKKKIRYEYIEV